jgi:hypothetical protein
MWVFELMSWFFRDVLELVVLQTSVVCLCYQCLDSQLILFILEDSWFGGYKS